MRTFVLLPLLLAGCVNPQPFELSVTNGGDAPTFVSAGAGSGPVLNLEEEINGQWLGLSGSLGLLCAPECGSLMGNVLCADLAPELGAAYGLLRGESFSKSYDGEFWYQDPVQGCGRRAPLLGSLRVTVCHGPSARLDDGGEVIDSIAQSGLLNASAGASVVNPTCEPLVFEVADPAVRISD